ncbi:GerAB/ArcD/ProY family transporter [Paenibacillus sp. BJ-4]|uniref:GerAB/ArcD/ProY family transporter n=1 Tax=Paenibacillus sp. BJ-4 TaxID=2878097 RepID=UPI001CEFD751|nr:endospore germination permease [Paenibacillus sp. BJ-4]
MSQQVKISGRQFMILTILFTIGSAILVIPSGMAFVAKQDAWIAALVGVGAGIFLVWMYNTIVILYPRMTLAEIIETLLGKWLGKTISLLFVVTLFLGGPSAVLYDVGNFLTTQIMPETPAQPVNILFAIIVVMGAWLGIETFARSAELLFPLFILLYISLVILVAPEVKLENVEPVLEAGIGPIWPAALSFISIVFLPHIVLLMIIPAVNRTDKARKAFFSGSMFGGLMMVLIIALTILVLGPDLTARSIFPSYSLAQRISIGNFLQRIEAIMAVMWFISLYFRTTIYMYVIVLVIAQIFNLKDYRPLILPLGMILVVMSVIIYPNAPYQQKWDGTVWVSYILSVGLFLPLLLLCIHVIRKLWSRKEQNPKGKSHL